MVILVAGLPGSGKSFFAERLAGRLGAAYFSSDRVRHDIQATGKYSYEDKLAIYDQLKNYTAAAIENGKHVVVDATFFHHSLRELFIRLTDSYGVSLKVIEVVADEELIRRRLAADRAFSEADFIVYEKVRNDFEEITMPHLTLSSTDTNIELMLKTALSYLEK